MKEQFDVSVVIGTYNRSELLAGALESLVAQQDKGIRYEVIVVDNNSTDDTRDVVKSFAGSDIPVSYMFEGRQGVSYARNTGIHQSRAPIIAFTDDDVRVAPDWITTIKRTFEEHPEVGFIGGKVLPLWSVTPPAWLTIEHWMPLALQDHGDSEFYLEPEKSIGVIGANLAVRRELFERVGGFGTDVQLIKRGIGAMEDHEYILRMWQAGVRGLYVPQLVVQAPTQNERFKKEYHRRWHKGHGYTYAILREERMEKASRYLLGVPSHLYRQALIDMIGLIKHSVRRQEAGAFLCEVHLRFFFAFWLKRVKDGSFDKRHHQNVLTNESNLGF